jgi:hypothetical protein
MIRIDSPPSLGLPMPNDTRASTEPDTTAWYRLDVAAAAAALKCALDRGLAHQKTPCSACGAAACLFPELRRAHPNS